MSNLLFSKGGISDSGGMRGGQISHALTGQYESLILNNQSIHSKNKTIILVKDLYDRTDILDYVKSNGNKLVFDVIDLLDAEKYGSGENNEIPNFLPDLPLDYFDGYIVNSDLMKEWFVENVDTDKSKPIFVIPHHWDMRFRWFPKGYYTQQPYFYYLGYVGHKEKNSLYLNDLLEKELINEIRQGGPPGVCKYFLDKPVNGCQLSIRKKNSWEYCFKPATKLALSSAMESVIITTNDWSVQHLLPNEYPYLLESSKYDDVVDMIKKVKDTFGGDEWVLAKEMLKEIKEVTSLDNLINIYKEIDKHFSGE